MNIEYVKDDEKIVISSSVPGVTVVPPGMKLEDGKPITEKKAEAHFKKLEDNSDYIDPIQQKLESLQAQVDELQQIQSDNTK